MTEAEPKEHWSSPSLSFLRYPYNASLTKKATLSRWRPRNTCYAQWSNLSKVTRKTSLSREAASPSVVGIAFTEPSRTHVPRLKIPHARKPVSSCAASFAEGGSPKSHIVLLFFRGYHFFPAPPPHYAASWWVYFDKRAQVRRTAREMKAWVWFKLPEETCCASRYIAEIVDSIA